MLHILWGVCQNPSSNLWLHDLCHTYWQIKLMLGKGTGSRLPSLVPFAQQQPHFHSFITLHGGVLWASQFYMGTASPDQLRSTILERTYQNSVESTTEHIKEAEGATIRIYGTTNVMARSICSFILYTPIPMFLEYWVAELRKDTAKHFKLKVCNCLNCIENVMGFKCWWCVLDSCKLMIHVRKLLEKDRSVNFTYGCFTML